MQATPLSCILGMFALENMIGSVATKFVVQALKAAILEITDQSGGVFSPPLASNVVPETGFSQIPSLGCSQWTIL